MSKLPSKLDIQNGHRQRIEVALCQRDYELMAEHHPEILDVIELAIADSVSPELIKRWATGTVGEPALVQRVFNAARYAVIISEN